MNINFAIGLFFILFVSYWLLLAKLTDVILESPRLKPLHWLVVGACNALILYCLAGVWSNAAFSYAVMISLMLAELYIFYKDSFAGALLCTLACSIHVIAIFMIMLGTFSLAAGYLPYTILADRNVFIWCCVCTFFFLDIAIMSVLKIVPLTKVKLINQHKEQQWFIIAWMFVSNLLLIFMGAMLYNPEYPARFSGSQVAVSLASLIGLYIVLFFSITTSALLGYKEKNIQLEEAIHQEQQYRNFMVRDAIVSYEVNVTENLMIKGFEEYGSEIGDTIRDVRNSYSDLLVLMSRKFIYSEDIAEFVRTCGRTNILRLFEKGEREFMMEYRRLVENAEYIWVRAIINLSQDMATGDVKAFVCVKNIDDEKKNQLELQRQAERDSLTGLYNRSAAGKLINEHISFCQSKTQSALFMVDVDNFKEINDHLGHIFGDTVLCELAEKLTLIFRNNDIVGRVGGDEYIVFLKDGATDETVEKKALEICRAFNVGYQGTALETHTISASVGVSFFPHDGDNFQQLYSNADVALYSAKSGGKNKYKIYDGSNFTAYTSKRTEIQAMENVLQIEYPENETEYPENETEYDDTTVIQSESNGRETQTLDFPDQLEKLLYVDALTGARTYHKFQIDAQDIFEKEPDVLRVLIKMDIANFKLINQIYGFEKGNEILRCVANAIEETLRNENDIYCRINNDEFLILFTIEKKEDIDGLIQTFLSHINQLFGTDFSFRCRFPHGRYIIEPGSTTKMLVHDMFEKVNIAHKTAKLNKTIDFEFYNDQMTHEALRVKEIENQMADALSNGEFSVYLQPKYFLKDETIGGAEALTRWGDEKHTNFSPNTFIPIFEQNGFIIKLDFYVFEKTCQVIKDWMIQGIEPVTVSVNFSRLHLDNPNFVKKLCKIADDIGIDRKYLEIEITETVIFDNIDTLGDLLDDLHRCGFSMSMDDFGSGYSSLGMLKDLPVDVIKMDRSFFANQRDADRSRIVVDSIIKMAENLGIHIVAEGVEEQTHIDFLRELKCDMVQGYYYAKPMPIDSFTKLLSQEKKLEQ